MNITIQPAQTINVDINSITIEFVRDSFDARQIIGKVNQLPMSFILWSGEAEYNAAGVWTNDSALARAKELIAQDKIIWAP